MFIWLFHNDCYLIEHMGSKTIKDCKYERSMASPTFTENRISNRLLQLNAHMHRDVYFMTNCFQRGHGLGMRLTLG